MTSCRKSTSRLGTRHLHHSLMKRSKASSCGSFPAVFIARYFLNASSARLHRDSVKMTMTKSVGLQFPWRRWIISKTPKAVLPTAAALDILQLTLSHNLNISSKILTSTAHPASSNFLIKAHASITQPRFTFILISITRPASWCWFNPFVPPCNPIALFCWW